MDSLAKVAATAAVVITAFAALVIPNVLEAREQYRIKKTMAAMRNAGQRAEQGKALISMTDEWGKPIRIRVRGRHYSLRSAGGDGVFEAGDPRGEAAEPGADIVFLDGFFAQHPGGI